MGTLSQAFLADGLTNSIVAINHTHQDNHDGELFQLSHVFASGNDHLIRLVTGSKALHGVIYHGADGVYTFQLIEGITNGAGTAVSVVNKNRNSSETTDVSASWLAAAPTGGTTLSSLRVGSTNFLGGASRDDDEWILAPNTTYGLYISTSANQAFIEVVFYETSKLVG